MGMIGIRIVAGAALIAASTVVADARPTERCAQFCGLNLERTGHVCFRECATSAVDFPTDPDWREQQQELRRELQGAADQLRNRLRSGPPRPTSE